MAVFQLYKSSVPFNKDKPTNLGFVGLSCEDKNLTYRLIKMYS